MSFNRIDNIKHFRLQKKYWNVDSLFLHVDLTLSWCVVVRAVSSNTEAHAILQKKSEVC